MAAGHRPLPVGAPREITRLLNITAGQGAGDLTRLALEDGISTFIVPGDDPDVLRQFAGEIAQPGSSAAGERRSRRPTAV